MAAVMNSLREPYRVPWTGWATLGTTIVLGVATVGLAIQVLSQLSDPASFLLVGVVVVPFASPLVAIAGLVIHRHRQGHPIGWVLLGLGVVGSVNAFLSYYSAYSILVQEGAWPLGHELGWVNSVISVFGFVLLTLAILLFPTGRLPTPRWRPLGWALWVLVLLWIVGQFGEGFFNGVWPWVENPFSLPSTLGSLSDVAFRMSVVLASGILGAAVVSLVSRYRRARGDERLQIKWFAFFGAVMALVHVVLVVAPNVIGPLGPISAVAFVAVIVMTILRYRLYDIDVVINKTFVYGALALFIGMVYVTVVVGFGSVVGARADNTVLAVAATTIVAVAFQPVRLRLQQVANRLVYGQRATPYEALSRFSEEMGGAYPIGDVLREMARVVADGIGAARVDVWLHRGDALAAEATWPDDAEPAAVLPDDSSESSRGGDGIVPVYDGNELLGAITYVKNGEGPTPIEQRLMTDFASQAGLVMRNARLTEELEERLTMIETRSDQLRRSRARLVAAQDAARRVLERDIHDGAQQHVVALTVKLGLARHLATAQPEKAAELLAEVGDDIEGALETLHDLARGIYPATLTAEGVAAALQAVTQRMSVPVTVTDDGIGRLPANVEAAIYFSSLEALQNVAKHAAATTSSVSLELKDGSVIFTVRDDGRGFIPDEVAVGSGLTNMEARVSAIDGRLMVISAPRRGTTITATIPVSREN